MSKWPVVAGVVGGLTAAVAVNELLGKPVPFLRWSFVRMMLGMKTLTTEWQVGDGREEAVAKFVTATARAGDVDHVIDTIDDFAYKQSFLINVGDKKGAILDEALERRRPTRVLEVGAYVGYSALRIARRLAEGAHVYTVEFNAANASIARRIIEHAGMQDRITVIVGSLGDDGKTIDKLRDEHAFTDGHIDFVFLDHDKEVYLSDLHLLLDTGWLKPGSVVMADNVGFPGVPDYKQYMANQQGERWETREHSSFVEYQSVIKDLVLESVLLN